MKPELSDLAAANDGGPLCGAGSGWDDDVLPPHWGPDASGTPLDVDLWTLARFKQWMADEGWSVHAARMIFDRDYAHECLARAHTSAQEPLRRLALELFRRLHARDGLAG